ncbi:MAG: hypothetical protein ACRC28_17315 [Clostridium sp.]
MSNTGNRRFKEDMVHAKREKINEMRKEEQRQEHKEEGNKFNHKKH